MQVKTNTIKLDTLFTAFRTIVRGGLVEGYSVTQSGDDYTLWFDGVAVAEFDQFDL